MKRGSMKATLAGRWALLVVLLAALGCAGSGARPALRAAPALTASLSAGAVPPIAPADLDRLLRIIQPQRDEAPFAQIPWLASVWEGRIEAAARGKPIVAFLMSGHPMGCT